MNFTEHQMTFSLTSLALFSLSTKDLRKAREIFPFGFATSKLTNIKSLQLVDSQESGYRIIATDIYHEKDDRSGPDTKRIYLHSVTHYTKNTITMKIFNTRRTTKRKREYRVVTFSKQGNGLYSFFAMAHEYQYFLPDEPDSSGGYFRFTTSNGLKFVDE